MTGPAPECAGYAGCCRAAARYVEVVGAHLVNVENPDTNNDLLVWHLVSDGVNA